VNIRARRTCSENERVGLKWVFKESSGGHRGVIEVFAVLIVGGMDRRLDEEVLVDSPNVEVAEVFRPANFLLFPFAKGDGQHRFERGRIDL
jgi:hypothetical protein